MVFSGAGPVCGLSSSRTDLSLCRSLDICCLSFASSLQRLHRTSEIYPLTAYLIFFFCTYQHHVVFFLVNLNCNLTLVWTKCHQSQERHLLLNCILLSYIHMFCTVLQWEILDWKGVIEILEYWFSAQRFRTSLVILSSSLP